MMSHLSSAGNSYRTFEQSQNEPVNERVQVYVRVRPIFKHELLEDMQAVQQIRNLKSPSPNKSNYYSNQDDDDDLSLES